MYMLNVCLSVSHFDEVHINLVAVKYFDCDTCIYWFVIETDGSLSC